MLLSVLGYKYNRKMAPLPKLCFDIWFTFLVSSYKLINNFPFAFPQCMPSALTFSSCPCQTSSIGEKAHHRLHEDGAFILPPGLRCFTFLYEITCFLLLGSSLPRYVLTDTNPFVHTPDQ